MGGRRDGQEWGCAYVYVWVGAVHLWGWAEWGLYVGGNTDNRCLCLQCLEAIPDLPSMAFNFMPIAEIETLPIDSIIGRQLRRW